MKKLLYYSVLAGIASAAFFACVDTHDVLPYVDPNYQYQKDQEKAGQLEEGTFISEKFSSSLGTCVSVSDNEKVNYTIDFSTAKVTGNVNSTKNAATVYLVTQTVDLSSAEEAYYTFEHIIAYEAGDLLQDKQFLISFDYDGDPTKATWIQLPISAVLNTGKPASWNEFVSTAFNLPKEYLKSNATFAFKYTSTTSSAATWEIKNFAVKTGSITETVAYENPKVEESSPEEPLTVEKALASVTSSTQKSYVTGYIVGYVDGQKLAEGAKFSAADCKTESNILIAATPEEKDYKNCLPVQLPANTKHRTALNLSAHKDILGKKVVLGGFIQSYFGVNGLKSLFYSALEGTIIDAPAESTGFDGMDNTTELLTAIDIKFKEAGIDKFSIYNINKADELGHVWTPSTQYGMVAKGSAADNKAWLISPRVDVSKCEKIEFYFNHSANNFPEAEGVDKKCAVYVSKDYAGGDPTKATWTKVSVENWSSNWTWVENTFDLTEYKADNLHIAFEYTSAATDGDKIGTFEINEVYLGEKRAPEVPVSGFDGESTLKAAAIPFEYDFKTEKKFGDFLVYDVKRFNSKDTHIWTAGSYGATAVSTKEAESWLISPKFTLESEKEYTLEFTNWYKNAEKPSEVFKAYISENFAGDFSAAKWTALEMTFGEASKNNDVALDLSAYAGKNIVIAFQYTASQEEKGTFEVIKISLKEEVKNEVPVSGFDGESTLKSAQIPFSYDFQTEKKLGDFLIYDVKRFKSKDTHIWTADEKYGAKAVSTKEAESWFISPKFTLESGKEYELKFTNSYLTAAKPAEVFKAYVLEDYTSDPSKATKKALTMEFAAEKSNKENTFDLSDYAGKNIVIAFQYTSSEEEKGTLEILKFSLTETVKNEEAVSGVDQTAGITDFTVYDVKKFTSADEHIWKSTADGIAATANKESESWLLSKSFALESGKGYQLTFSTNTDKAAADAKKVYKAYVLKNYVSGNPTTADKTEVEVLFSKGNNKANEITLTSYAGNSITIAFQYTSTEEDKGKFQIKDFKVEEIVPETPEKGFDGENTTITTIETASLPYIHDFKTQKLADLLVYDIQRYKSKDAHIWVGDNSYGAKATSKETAESWLISPKFALASGKEYELYFTNSFKNAANPSEVYSAYISEDYSDNPETATWTKLSMEFGSAEQPEKENKISLNDYAGKSVVIAFKYTSTESEKGTFDVFKLSVSEIIKDEVPVSGFDGESTVKTATLPFSYDFKSKKAFGDFLVYDVKRYDSKDEHIWIAGTYGATAEPTTESESWLISPKFTLESGKEYTLKFTNYYKNTTTPAECYGVYISENFSDNVASATWTSLNITFGDASKNNTVTVDLSSYAGKSFVIAFKYTSSEEVKSTFEIINFSLKENVAIQFEGDGTYDKPYTCADLLKMTDLTTSSSDKGYVMGYIVGSCSGSNINTANFNADNPSTSNLIIATSPNEKDYSQCVSVKPSSNTIKSLILVTSNNIGKKVILYGTIKSYLSTSGLNTATYAELYSDGTSDPQTAGTKPTN